MDIGRKRKERLENVATCTCRLFHSTFRHFSIKPFTGRLIEVKFFL